MDLGILSGEDSGICAYWRFQVDRTALHLLAVGQREHHGVGTFRECGRYLDIEAVCLRILHLHSSRATECDGCHVLKIPSGYPHDRGE